MCLNQVFQSDREGGGRPFNHWVALQLHCQAVFVDSFSRERARGKELLAAPGGQRRVAD